MSTRWPWCSPASGISNIRSEPPAVAGGLKLQNHPGVHLTPARYRRRFLTRLLFRPDLPILARNRNAEEILMKLLFASFLLFITAGAYSVGRPQKKPEPCPNAQSQAEMNDCAGREYKKADAELNQTYQRLVAMLEADEKTQLKAVETTWIKYRDANCDFVADQFKGGTMRPMVLGFCLADMTHNRTNELKDQIKDRSN